ncbi:MAG: type I restriction-modification system subunit M N-terminal domain-containing protein [Nitrospirales bacterium]
MSQLEHIEAIETRLWSVADNLRANSNYASNEYFMPVIGLVFLRHAYSRYLNEWDHRPGARLWQRNYYEHIIPNEDELTRIRRYHIDNPTQWEMHRRQSGCRGSSGTALTGATATNKRIFEEPGV